jgi:hypothetical protein
MVERARGSARSLAAQQQESWKAMPQSRRSLISPDLLRGRKTTRPLNSLANSEIGNPSFLYVGAFVCRDIQVFNFAYLGIY